MQPFHNTSTDSPAVESSRFNWIDTACMNRAIDLAWHAAGLTNPNPMVGAVVVNGGEAVGEGFHHRCGEAHAEVVALDRAGGKAEGSTLYVSLEPCVHHGRTPPCVDRIIAEGVRRVVIPTADPDSNVCGAGVQKLRAAGIVVDTGCLDLAAITTNLSYYKNRLGMGSTVILKMASTMDGKIASAPGKRDRITGEESMRYVHRMRANSCGIVVGIGTVRTDDPVLDCRKTECGEQPVPVVLDGGASLDPVNRWSGQGRRFVVAVLDSVGDKKRAAIEDAGGLALACNPGGDGRVDPEDLVGRLFENGIARLLVEGGAAVFESFLNSGAWDAMYLFQGPRVFGNGGVGIVPGRGVAIEAEAVDALRLGNDILSRYINRTVAAEIRSRLKEVSGE
jgi:diaminohydroxyphosphoribosylaminopyrimidine deaminase/5-amino-6-(5-phosphoribosylamino)uracil reductase